jgi:hypothetical protein
MGISISEFSELSKELTNSLKDISQQIDYLQDQMDSLAAVVQNRHGLDLLIAAQGGLCALLEEYCCFLTNKSDWYEMEHDNSGNRQTAAPPPFPGYYGTNLSSLSHQSLPEVPTRTSPMLQQRNNSGPYC